MVGTQAVGFERVDREAAVSPAVPSAIAWRADSPSGSATTHAAGTRAYCAQPPWCATPRS